MRRELVAVSSKLSDSGWVTRRQALELVQELLLLADLSGGLRSCSMAV